MKADAERLDVTSEELAALVEGARATLGEAGYQKLQAAIRTLGYVTELLETRQATLEKLRRLLCHSSTEKTKTVLQQAGIETGDKKRKAPDTPKGKAPGHGRNGAAAYRGARKVEVPHASLKPGDQCPDCQRGKVYPQRDPGVLVRIQGQAPIAATVYELEKLRCNLCGNVFTAAAPEEAGEEKYDETAASMIALLRYGSGFPWYRLEGLQKNLGIPLPVATQCEIVNETAAQIQPAGDELIRQAAQGGVVHNDDTSMRVLSLDRGAASDVDIAAERTGVFTSGIVSVCEGHRIGLYFTGRKHAGENLADVLKQRAAGLAAPIQMCDALSRNLPKKLAVIIAHCMAHARRRFVEVTPNFPEECRFVLESLGEVYGYDEAARAQSLSPEQRLRFHQEHSGPVMERLHIWLDAQFDERRVEPNSGLGQAISYLLKHWDRLTLFLRQSGAPLDNNTERTLRGIAVGRNNWLFVGSDRGGKTMAILRSFVGSCELVKVDPFAWFQDVLSRIGEQLMKALDDLLPHRWAAAQTQAPR
jgi:transposase